MNSNLHNRDAILIAVNYLESILCDGSQIAAASTAEFVVKNMPNALHSLKAALQEVVAPIPSAEGDDRFSDLTNSTVLEERSV